MKIAFLFPGQGTQSIGMGEDLYNKYNDAKKIYNKVEKITGINIKKISFEGPKEILNETENTQIAILTECLGILEVLKNKNINAEMSAGLSLGEYTALIEDGVFNFEDGVKLVQKRGIIMQELVPRGKWKMAAILGLREEEVKEICKKVKNGFVVPANYNTIRANCNIRRRRCNYKSRRNSKKYGSKKSNYIKHCRTISYRKIKRLFSSIKKRIGKYKN